MQVWQWGKRQPGKPAAFRQHTFHKEQPGDSLVHKLQAIRFTLDEEERLEIYRFPLCETARDSLNRQLKAGIKGQDLAELVLALRREGRFCQVQEGDIRQEPQIICSLGLSRPK